MASVFPFSLLFVAAAAELSNFCTNSPSATTYGVDLGETKLDKSTLSFGQIADWGVIDDPTENVNGYKNDPSIPPLVGDTLQKFPDLDFIINSGDSFYQTGVTTVTDPRWDTTYQQPIGAKVQNKYVYSALGNHVYKGNVNGADDATKAQIEFTNALNNQHKVCEFTIYRSAS